MVSKKKEMEKIEEMLGMKNGELTSVLVDVAIRLAIAFAVLVIGFWVAKKLSLIVSKLLDKKKVDKSLSGFLSSITGMGIKMLVVVTAISQMGVEMTSFIAILGAAGFAVGMAFSGTLSNFAGGVMILFFKPFKIGDYVNMQGEEGVVKEVLIFNTILTTLDNKIIILANSAVANGTIVNFTKAENRRVDWSFGIAYGDDLKIAKALLLKFISEDDRILKNPAPFVGLGELGDSSVNVTTRAWVNHENYWAVFFDMNERVYNEFEAAGLSIPFPQMDVHVKKEG